MIGPPGTVEHPGADPALQSEQLCAVDAAERLSGVVDRPCAHVVEPVRVDVHALTQHVHELHQVDRCLAQAVSGSDQPERPHRTDAFGRIDRPIAVLVDPSPAERQHHRR
jgi:hypothetical protein